MIQRDEYDALDREHWTRLHLIDRSPAHYRYAVEHQIRSSTPDQEFGIAAHMATLEPVAFEGHYAIWTEGRRAGKKWDAFELTARAEGRDILTSAELGRVRAVANSVTADPIASQWIIGNEHELAITWEIDGLMCKGRVDSAGAVGIADLKFVRDASPSGFGRAVARYGYLGQAAWYVDGFRRARGISGSIPFAFVAVEKSPPYLVQVYTVSERILEVGRELYTTCLRTLQECTRSNTWPGYARGELAVELPSWAGVDDDDLSELGIDTGGE
jgi:hypothetical protein